MIEIYAKSISMKEMIARYGVESAGDYWRPRQELINIRALELGNPDYEFLIILHEIIEEYLCTKRGIKETDIQAFDQKFSEEGGEGEPGDDKRAPYYKEHQFATKIEKLMATQMGIKWRDYSRAVDKAMEIKNAE